MSHCCARAGGSLGMRLLLRFLGPEAREVALGDFEELDISPMRALYELCGLIGRQQANYWKDWRPWLALLGIAGLAGIRLAEMAGDLMAGSAIYIRTYRAYGVLYESGLTVTQELIIWISLALGIVLWSWTAGFVFVRVACKTALFTSTLLCVAWVGLNVLLVGWAMFPGIGECCPTCLWAGP